MEKKSSRDRDGEMGGGAAHARPPPPPSRAHPPPPPPRPRIEPIDREKVYLSLYSTVCSLFQ